MKVALVHHRLAQVGGLESRMRMYIDFFSARGDEVHVFTAKHYPDFSLPENINLHIVQTGFMPKRYRRWYFNKKLNKLFNPQDFDFSLSMERTAQQMASISPGDHLGFLKAKGQKGLNVSDRLQIQLDKACFTNSKAIFPCSELIRQDMITYYQVPDEKIMVLHPPLNHQKFRRFNTEEEQQFALKFGMNSGRISFVIGSTSHNRKGIPLLLDLFKRLDASRFELFIAGKPEVKTSVPNVHFLGYVRNMEELYAAADFSIHPSWFEPYGQVISESLACGTPVIISEMTGWSDTLPKEYGVVVKGFDPDNWKSAIEALQVEDFNIPGDLAERHELTVQHHMQKMLRFYTERTGISL